MRGSRQRPGASLNNMSINSEEQMAAAIDDLVQQARSKGEGQAIFPKSFNEMNLDVIEF